jgi:acyl carrier protein
VRELLLLGRSGADAVRRQALEEWKRQGVRAVPVAADCADAPALERALSAWRTGGGARFGGVCHVAGAWQDAPLADLDSAGLDAVWRPKVGGARALERALASDPVGQWIYFSAFSALLPALGQGNYAAANAWLDAQARAQRAGGARALALDWGPWSEAGFALTPYGRRAHERLETLGIARLRPAEGLAVLDRALASGEPQLGAMPVDWPRFFAADPAARLSPLLAELAARHAGAVEADPEEGRIAKAIAACPPAEHAVLLTEEMRRLVGGVLRLAPGQVPADVPFTELGVDSLMAIEIKNRLQRQAGVDVPLTDLLRGPTAGGLAAALLPRAKAAALAHGAPASGPVEEIEI